jgi:putative Holliday junction resolvase
MGGARCATSFLDLAEDLLVAGNVGLQRAQHSLGVARRRNDARADPGARHARLDEHEVQDELGVGVIDEDQIGVGTLGGRLVDVDLNLLGLHRRFGLVGHGCSCTATPRFAKDVVDCEPAMKRVIGIDLGSRRIGVALSDGLGLTAQPHTTIARHGGSRDIEAIARRSKPRARSASLWACRWIPTGEEGPAALRARAFAEKLHAALAVPVDLIDESFSTVEAEVPLLAADVSRARRKQVVDKLAAAVILQRWLDSHRREMAR